MYWTDWELEERRGKIRRANLDGSNVETLVIGEPSRGIALYTVAGKVYWTNWNHDGNGSIRRANLDGTNVELLVAGLGTPRDIALDAARGKMYWTESTGSIRRADLNGANVETLLADLPGPNHLALDLTRGKVYWTDGEYPYRDRIIRRANLDGSNSEDLLTGLDSLSDLALDVAAGKIYWTDESGILRANLDGSSAELLLREMRYLRGIALNVPPTDTVATAIQPSSLPARTALLANYPNPFNPETWIPYQLHAPAEVRLSIFDVRGALVRAIDLGYRPAGRYLLSPRAAYWDGRDQHGQPAASGVYVYRLQAGASAHVRKMLVLK